MSRVLRRQNLSSCNRESLTHVRATVPFHQLRDSEIKKLYAAVIAYQNVRGLQIPVHNQVGVRLRDSFKHIQKENDARMGVKTAAITVVIDLVTLNILKN